MADCREDRHRTAGDRDSQIVVVKAGQIKLRSASAHDQDCIVTDIRRKDGVEGGHDGSRSRLALHECLEEMHVEHEAIFIVLQMTAEVAVACGVAGGNDCK